MIVPHCALACVALIVVLDVRQCYQYCFDADVLNLLPKQVNFVLAFLLSDFVKSLGQSPFEVGFVFFELLRVLVDGVVSEMHHQVFVRA